MKRGSVKRPRKPRPTCRHATGDNRETGGPLEQQLPERERAVLSRARSFCLGISKKKEEL
jgi:hypothetical protein